jgi:hypothetical protein
MKNGANKYVNGISSHATHPNSIKPHIGNRYRIQAKISSVILAKVGIVPV